MYIDTIPNRNSPPAILLREGRRQGKRIIKRTLANLSHWPQFKVEALRALLNNQPLVSPRDAFMIERSLPHGHVLAVLGMIHKLGLDVMLSYEKSRDRDLVVAMIAERLIHPCSKLATTRLWHATTLAEELSIQDAGVDELYDALDWLLQRQKGIEKKLARKHLQEGGFVLYDLTSSYYEGHKCTLAQFGHDRDGKGDRPIIVYGVLTDREGRPVSVNVYPGNTADPRTVPDQVYALRERFNLKRVVLVGDRGMLTQTQIDHLKEYPGLGWITALRSVHIRRLVHEGPLQGTIFDKDNLVEIAAPDIFPGEQLVACYNDVLAKERHRKREEMLKATEKELEKLRREVERRRRKPLGKEDIGLKAGKVIGHYKMGKHFRLKIGEGAFSYQRNTEGIRQEEALDGIYVIRTSEPSDVLSSKDVVRNYKMLSRVERIFRTVKGIDILVRPIRHFTEDHVRAHIFLCFMAYYVEWHMREALSSLLFQDEELSENRMARDPVSQALSSASAMRKKSRKKTPEGFPVHSFESLMPELGTLCRNQCRIKSNAELPSFVQLTEPTAFQKRVFELLGIKCSQ
jgi:transposase